MKPRDLAALIDAHAARLILYARQWCDAPEDVVQETFLKLVRLSGRPDDVIAWLYHVTRNSALDAGKIQRRRQKRETIAARPSTWFVESAVDGLDAEIAVAALQQLPDEEREVITARLWGGLSFDQIAAVVGCSASSAHRRFSAGIESLRRILRVPCSETSSTS